MIRLAPDKKLSANQSLKRAKLTVGRVVYGVWSKAKNDVSYKSQERSGETLNSIKFFGVDEKLLIVEPDTGIAYRNGTATN